MISLLYILFGVYLLIFDMFVLQVAITCRPMASTIYLDTVRAAQLSASKLPNNGNLWTLDARGLELQACFTYPWHLLSENKCHLRHMTLLHAHLLFWLINNVQKTLTLLHHIAARNSTRDLTRLPDLTCNCTL